MSGALGVLVGALALAGCEGLPAKVRVQPNPHDRFGAIVQLSPPDRDLLVHVEYSADGDDLRQTPATVVRKGELAARLVRGLLADSTYDLEVVAREGAREWRWPVQQVQTDPLPADWPTCTLDPPASTAQFGDQGVICVPGVLGDSGDGVLTCVDQQARPRFSLQHPSGLIMRVVQPLPQGGFGAVGYDSSQLVSFKAGGKAASAWPVSWFQGKTRFSHEFIDGHELIGFADGDWQYAVAMITATWETIGQDEQGQDKRRLGNGIIVFDMREQAVLWDWSAHGQPGDGQPIDPLLDYDRLGVSASDPTRFMHANALQARTTPDGQPELWMSLRHQDWVIAIDPRTDAIKWRLGRGGDFRLVEDLDAAQDDIVRLGPEHWFYAQHAPRILSQEGSRVRLLIFDNGKDRPGDHPDDYSRAVELTIDTDTMLAAPGFVFGASDPSSPDFMYAAGGGNAELLPDGRTVQILEGWDGTVLRHVDMQTGRTLWTWRCPDMSDEREQYRAHFQPDLYAFGR